MFPLIGNHAAEMQLIRRRRVITEKNELARAVKVIMRGVAPRARIVIPREPFGR